MCCGAAVMSLEHQSSAVRAVGGHRLIMGSSSAADASQSPRRAHGEPAERRRRTGGSKTLWHPVDKTSSMRLGDEAVEGHRLGKVLRRQYLLLLASVSRDGLVLTQKRLCWEMERLIQ